jgi:hypothetical protein
MDNLAFAVEEGPDTGSVRAASHRQQLVRAAITTTGAIILLAAQSHWSPVAGSPVTMAFRCEDNVGCPSGDRVQGDPSGPYVGNPTTSLGEFFNANNDLALRLDTPGGQYLFVDFSAATGAQGCAASGSCRRVGAYAFSVQTFNTIPHSGGNPVGAADNPLPNGLLDIPISTQSNARMKINFPDPDGRALLWTVRYNPTVYPGSTFVTVRRTSASSWTVTTSPSPIAKLVSWASHSVEVDEGTFAIPFQVTVTQP